MNQDEMNNNQDLMLFIRKAYINEDPNINGIGQFSNPSIKNGVIVKEIILILG